MSAHAVPTTCRCLWCPRTFGSAAEASSHMHLMHAVNLIRTQDHEAAARLQHYHADRMAVERGRAMAEDSADTPRGAGKALAQRLQGTPDARFLSELDDILNHMREQMTAAGRSLAGAMLLCREIRQAARQEWARLSAAA